MKKKIICILSIIILMCLMLFILTGCSEDVENTETTSSKENTISELNQTATSKVEIKNEGQITDYVAAAEEQMKMPEEGDTIAIIHVKDFGDIYVKFFEESAPKAVENFVTHAKEGYYDGITFHRVMNEFMIQGGDPLGTGTGGESIWGEDFGEEIDEAIKPYRGTLCMASRGTVNTPSLGSQFFITQAHYNENMEAYMQYFGASESLIEAYKKYEGDIVDLYYGDLYTVFGQVYQGMDVVDKIAAVETNVSNNKPIEDVVIESIEVTTYSK